MSIKLIPVECLPETVYRGYRTNMAQHIWKFLDMGVDCAKVEFEPEDYVNVQSCAASLKNACMVWSDGRVSTVIRNNEVYLVRVDPTTKKRVNA